jgi:LPS sulfotransferase NodH
VGESPTRIFLVGYPRSGTSLLQSLLAGHRQLTTVPETFFFSRFRGARHWRQFLRRPEPAKRERLAELATLDRRLAPLPLMGSIPASLATPLSARFVAAMDDRAAAGGAGAWLEKTPGHLHRVRLIETHVEGAVFVHMVRRGTAAVLSLVDVTARNHQWGGPRSVDACAARWNLDIRTSYERRGHRGHLFVSYENLVADPSAVLVPLLAALGLGADRAQVDAMLSGYAEANAVLSRREPWKAGVAGTIADRNEARTGRLSARERERLGRDVSPGEDLVRRLDLF